MIPWIIALGLMLALGVAGYARSIREGHGEGPPSGWAAALADGGRIYTRTFEALMLGGFLYALLLGAAGIWTQRPPRDAPPSHRFAILVPAHNEASVIGDLVRNLRCTDYPRDMFDIFVIADNCTDDTARVAVEAGAHVWERDDPANASKGHALRWALERLFALDDRGTRYDAVVIFDADNAVALNFLAKMNACLSRGRRVIQGYLGTKNPYDSRITRFIWMQYALTNRLWQLGKEQLGLGVATGGTGFCIATDLLRRYGWPAFSLTEDLELQVQLALDGERITWVHDAVIYDEKPTSFRVAWAQRCRWMIGHAQVLCRYGLRLLGRGIFHLDLLALDTLYYLASPLVGVLVGTYIVVGLLLQFNGLRQDPLGGPILAIALSAIYWAAYLPAGLLMERIPLRNYPLFAVASLVVPLLWIGLCGYAFLRLRETRWYHTAHSAQLDASISLRPQEDLVP
ncbi:MAG: glycosyltransferase family 2 protein [Armatimonadetes bacterium]|nr:glycosyltransferase family 2 protein [Armatimonadota bacterium]